MASSEDSSNTDTFELPVVVTCAASVTPTRQRLHDAERLVQQAEEDLEAARAEAQQARADLAHAVKHNTPENLARRALGLRNRAGSSAEQDTVAVSAFDGSHHEREAAGYLVHVHGYTVTREVSWAGMSAARAACTTVARGAAARTSWDCSPPMVVECDSWCTPCLQQIMNAASEGLCDVRGWAVDPSSVTGDGDGGQNGLMRGPFWTLCAPDKPTTAAA